MIIFFEKNELFVNKTCFSDVILQYAGNTKKIEP